MACFAADNNSVTPTHVMFGDTEVPVQQLGPGWVTCTIPPHAPGPVLVCLIRDGEPCSNEVAFDFVCV